MPGRGGGALWNALHASCPVHEVPLCDREQDEPDDSQRDVLLWRRNRGHGALHALSPHRDFPSLDPEAHAVHIVELIQPEQLFERRAFIGRRLEWALVVREGRAGASGLRRPCQEAPSAGHARFAPARPR